MLIVQKQITFSKLCIESGHLWKFDNLKLSSIVYYEINTPLLSVYAYMHALMCVTCESRYQTLALSAASSLNVYGFKEVHISVLTSHRTFWLDWANCASCWAMTI